MSADSTPITPSAFAAALPPLSLPSLHLKVLELRNSIAHLDYSNEQLHPFATASPPDDVCVEAIAENNIVIERMQERIRLVREEVESRGFSWTEFQSKEELEALDKQEPGVVVNGEEPAQNGERQRHSAWTDGTFQTGRVVGGEVVMDQVAGGRGGGHQQQQRGEGEGEGGVQGQQQQTQTQQQGGSIGDEELRRRMEERLRDMGVGGDDEEGGMHL
ncbi:hypothetical protein QBC40DRAFT_277625 [Triangularia verruculosa]|uniref:Uncharacterized protein n=1 Tax=Triangularia verruculosa TaxID=2587418 RepID=A0AAN6XJM4_9PEZI|nr:hypothetical protein QBC40DRAFT_277625 [Triangularia verruculosa]